MRNNSLVTLNGARVVRARLVVPLEGAWWADVEVEGSDASVVAGAVSLEWEGVGTFRGAARRGASFAGTVEARIVGGGGGMPKVLAARHYRRVSARTVANDIATEAGETLDPASDVDVELEHWTREGSHAALALSSLARSLGLAWRMTPAGSLLLKAPTWPDAGLVDLDILNRDSATGRVEVRRWALPGTTVAGERVARATASVGDQGTAMVLEVGDRATLDALIRRAVSHVDYFGTYAATVILQAADGTLELDLEDPRFPDLAGVPIDFGTPGTTAKVPRGTRVGVTWKNGDPAKPRVVSFDAAGGVTELSLGGGLQAVARVGDVVSCTIPPGTPFSGVSPTAGAFESVLLAPVPITGVILTGASKVRA
ncbi:MAG: hypothetical protein IPG50_21720 [Myxococcales bacterium]|nr:hypothetical protein [Myxococcales bacterium]